MKMAGNALLHLLVILLAFTHLISLDSVMASRSTTHLLHENGDFQGSEDFNQISNKEEIVEEIMDGRMVSEVPDYGTGPNNRHTPKQPPGRD